MRYIIDTNIFLRVLVKENEESFQECLTVLEAIKRKDLIAFVPGVVLSEIAWTLHSYYHLPKPKIIEALSSILNLRGLTIIDDYDYPLALSLYDNHVVKYIDAVIASLRLFQESEVEIISYDTDFSKLNIKRSEPGKVSVLLKNEKN